MNQLKCRWIHAIEHPRVLAYLLLAPSLLVLVGLGIYPLLYSLYISFTNLNVISFLTGGQFVGLRNYLSTLRDAVFWRSLWITTEFVVISVGLETVLGLGLALLLNHRLLRGRHSLLAVLLMPFMMVNVAIALIFRMLLDFQFGVVNYGLQRLGLASVNWLADPGIALWSLIGIDVWNTTAFVALLLLNAMLAMPEEHAEAAQLDGASPVQTFWYITLPLLRPYVFLAVLWRFIDTFRIFDVVYVLTGGGPAEATNVLSLYVFRKGFQFFDLGVASAVSYLMVVVTLVVSAIYVRVFGYL
jgi:multiple sugar transport system permease protein